jgi:2-phosphoglycerate kinase
MSQPRRIDPLPLGGEGELPFSKGLIARALTATGISAVRAYDLAQRVEADMRSRDERSVTLERLQEVAVGVVGEDDAARAIRRLRRLGEIRALDLPIIVLVGGATGTGKSTVATEVAHRLGITRVTSTDFVRQTMRAFFSEEFLASVHHSSFEAGESVPPAERQHGDPLMLGFIDQTRHVLTGVRASIDRALEEGWSMVLEGVHLVPGMLQTPEDRPAVVVHVVVAVESESLHARHFLSRHELSAGVRAQEKYLGRLADIRRLQEFIVGEAEREGVPVVFTGNLDNVQSGTIENLVGTVIDLVFERAAALQQTV